MSDLISRSALIEALEEDKKSICSHVYATVPAYCVDDLEFELEYLISIQPTVEAREVVHGKWIEKHYTWTCDQCGCHPYRGFCPVNPTFKFCPECGAKMKGVE